MTILTIRTDKPEAELGLFSVIGPTYHKVEYIKWQAHRELAETIHTRIKELLEGSGKSWDDIEGIACYEGPGSFTGLRIGLSVANALAYAQNIPITQSSGKDWIEKGIQDLMAGKNIKIAKPEYGGPANTTKPRK